MTILITGFSTRENASNASDVLVTSLRENLPDALAACANKLHFALIDADTYSLRATLENMLQTVAPSACVFVGQAPGRNNITLERVAGNLRFTGPPQAVGAAPPSDHIDTAGPHERWATLPDMEMMIAQLHVADIPTAFSENAGNIACATKSYMKACATRTKIRACRTVVLFTYPHCPSK